MNNYIKILLIVIFLSNCSFLDKKKYDSNFSEEECLDKKFLNQNYIGMTREQIIYIFGIPIISDSFSDAYHYCFYNASKEDSQKKILNLYFKDNKVFSFDIK